jgi:hypothetical protein
MRNTARWGIRGQISSTFVVVVVVVDGDAVVVDGDVVVVVVRLIFSSFANFMSLISQYHHSFRSRILKSNNGIRLLQI